MNNPLVFNFKTDISRIIIPEKLNNPFEVQIPEIVSIATKEFQEFITLESKKWTYDFGLQKGKMFGVLVVQKEDGSYAFLGTVSGKLTGSKPCKKFVPSIFDDSTGDFFINKGMTALTEIGIKIKKSNIPSEIMELKERRKLKSFALQQRLFENYQFLNLSGMKKNVIEIFKNSSHGNPPSAAGECAAPKLLHYAFSHQLRPIGLTEFWWGNPTKSNERKHKTFYPACKNKCRPILEYMLNDSELFEHAKIDVKQNEMQYERY